MKHKFFSIVTKDVAKLSEFYKTILQAETKGIVDLENYVELYIDDFVVCVESVASVENRSGASFPASSVFIEFEVGKVDDEYARLKKLGVSPFQEPFDNPWKTRNFYFNDPDGNLVCFYTDFNVTSNSE